MLRDNIGLIQE